MKRAMKFMKGNISALISILVTLVVMFFLIQPVSAYDNCISGSWHDPNVQSEGADISVLDGSILAKMYTYSESTNHQRWYTMIFDSESNGLAPIYTSKDKVYREVWDVGNASIDILSDDEILLILNLNLDLDSDMATPWCIGCIRTFQYTRLTRPITCE